MKRILLLLQIVLFRNISSAQPELENQDYLYLYSDSIILAGWGNLKYINPTFGQRYFVFDSIKYIPDKVKFYQKDYKFFANTKKRNSSGPSSFIQRSSKGKINLFQTEKVTYILIATITTINTYYNKGFDDLKNGTYKNLSEDLADNPESMAYLKKYKSTNNLLHLRNAFDAYNKY